MKKSTQRIVAIAASAALLTGVGVAYAAWTTSGSGDGTATAGTDAAMTVSSTAITALVPATNQTVKVKVLNPNLYAVKLSALDAVVTVPAAASTAGCTVPASLVTYTAPSAADLAATSVPKGTVGTGGAVVPGEHVYDATIAMGADSNNACKNVVFTLTYTATGASAAS